MKLTVQKLEGHRATSENNCVKTNKVRHILSAVQIIVNDSSFWKFKVCGYSVGFSRKETSNESGCLMRSHGEVYLLCA